VSSVVFSPGDRVGRIRLERLLGEGASGFVFAARDDDGSAVAVKILRPEQALEDAPRSRFLREARLAGEIDSRHVVPIHHVGESGGVPYLVLPLYDRSLAERLRGGPLALAVTVDLAAQLGRGLDALHAHGILHRDVKPSNVLLARDGTAALSDFGLARASDSTRLTREGQVLGTPHYLAPELIEGRQATEASDIYALGCLLYECVTGAPPFAGRSPAEVGFAHLVERPPEPAGVSPELVLALLGALEKDPAARPTSGTALARMLHLARTASPA
jgi:serine/threonine protein kinase